MFDFFTGRCISSTGKTFLTRVSPRTALRYPRRSSTAVCRRILVSTPTAPYRRPITTPINRNSTTNRSGSAPVCWTWASVNRVGLLVIGRCIFRFWFMFFLHFRQSAGGNFVAAFSLRRPGCDRFSKGYTAELRWTWVVHRFRTGRFWREFELSAGYAFEFADHWHWDAVPQKASDQRGHEAVADVVSYYLSVVLFHWKF